MLSRSTPKNPNRSSRRPKPLTGGLTPDAPVLRDQEIHVWRASLDLPGCDLDFLGQHLSAQEWDKANRFRFGAHHDRYIAAHGMVRLLLARYLDCEPSEVALGETQFGKPFIISPAPLEFNLAHSEGMLLVAVSRQPVGVDIENRRPLEDIDLLVRTVFTEDEMARWKTIPPEARHEAFFRLWTRKEALLKGIGCGIADHTREVCVHADQDATIECPPELTKLKWHVINLNSVVGYAAAVATPISSSLIVEKPLDSSNWL